MKLAFHIYIQHYRQRLTSYHHRIYLDLAIEALSALDCNDPEALSSTYNKLT